MSTISEEILQELRQVSPAIAMPDRPDVYSAPVNYFESLPGNIMQRVRAAIGEQSMHLPADHPFTVPQGYFDNLAGNILSSVTSNRQPSEVEQELAEIAPLLNTISKKMLYTVPANYFEQPVMPVQKTPAKVVSMGSRESFRYAVAAAVAGIIGVSTWFLAPENNNTSIVNATNINVPAAVKTVSDSDIIDFLDKNSFGPEVSSTQQIKDVDVYIDRVIKKVSDQEIEEYLDENQEPVLKNAKES